MGTTNAAPPAIVADERHAEWRVEVIKENALHFVFAVSVRVAQQRDPVAGTGYRRPRSPRTRPRPMIAVFMGSLLSRSG